MSGEWKEVVRLRFSGQRFHDHALDLTALSELSQFQKLIAETAKALWRATNPNRSRLPARFDDRTRLCLRTIQDGSATAPLEVFIEEPDDQELFDREPPDELTQAVDVAFRVYSSIEADSELPEELPKELVAEYAKWGSSLVDDELIELTVPNRKSTAKLTPMSRERLARRADTHYTDVVEITGEVFEANVRQLRFQMLTSDGTTVGISFNNTQESEVTTALRDHRAIRLFVRGNGEFSQDGQLQRIHEVECLKAAAPDKTAFDPSARSIEDELAEIAAQIPADAWDELPDDLNDHLDHYLYGTPKE